MSLIKIRDAYENTLKHIDLDIPTQKIVVVTGVSGSGKSSLVVDTICQEGRRRYCEFVSNQGGGWMSEIPRFKVKSIEGLPPLYFVGSSMRRDNVRSTVGTLSDIQDTIRMIYSHFGDVYCPHCQNRLKKWSVSSLIQELILYQDQKLIIKSQPPGGTTLAFVRKEGFLSIWQNQRVLDVDRDKIEEDKPFDVVVDRLVIRKADRQRLAQSLEQAFRYGAGCISVVSEDLSLENAYADSYRCLRCKFNMPDISPALFSPNHPEGACPDCHGLGFNVDVENECDACKGTRFKASSLSVKWLGKNIWELGELSLVSLDANIQRDMSCDSKSVVRTELSKKILSKLKYIREFGLDYLSLNRRSVTLSSGEVQRLTLASRLDEAATGILYVLDEPSIGLGKKEKGKLIELIKRLRDFGNSVILVEHDRDMIQEADFIIELGPCGGPAGGEIIVAGSKDDVMKKRESVTRELMLHEEVLISSDLLDPIHFIEVKGISFRNLMNLDVSFPLGCLSVVTGVSGSGKTTLVRDALNIIWKNARNSRKNAIFKSVKGFEHIRNIFYVEGSFICRNPRSNVAMILRFYDFIRELFSKVPEARMRGYRPSRFSFNIPDGRCASCDGRGIHEVKMYGMPEFEVGCVVCEGMRFNHETLQVKFKGYSISEVLSLTVHQAMDVFSAFSRIRAILNCANQLGLGYLTLGQCANELSDGEALRLQLSLYLTKRTQEHNLYILDEPSRGLHTRDIFVMLGVFRDLVKKGHSVMMIEHHSLLVASADYVIELGPGAGENGGKIVFEGLAREYRARPR